LHGFFEMRFAYVLLPGLVFTAWLQVFGAVASDFAAGLQTGQITNRALAEISGIVGSQKNPGVLWVHNDLARPQVYAVSTNGQLLATWTLGQAVADFEDIAIGPGPLPEVQYIYCGDIGDNAAARPGIRVYRAAEPAVYAYQSANPLSRTFPLVESFSINYPDGSHNAEELMIDPLSGDLFIATKEANRSRIYRAGRSQLTNNAPVTLELVREVDFDLVSAGDIRADGLEIILRQEEFAKVWQRTANQTIAQALEGAAKAARVIGTPTEPNGEGITFAAEGRGYYTISEGSNPKIYFFARTNGILPFRTTTLIEPGSEWRYLDSGADAGTEWRNPGYADSTWPVGRGQFGYGEGDERTTLSFGANAGQKRITTYFRRQFVVEKVSTNQALVMSVIFDDGVAVYLDGTEVLRSNLETDAKFSDRALAAGVTENIWQTFMITNALRSGTNTVAVEVHRASVAEEDLSFDLQLAVMARREAPAFALPLKRTSALNWTVDFQVAADSAVFVEKSSNLWNWTNLETLLPTNGGGSFPFNIDLTVPSVFYRLRQ
jgi:hypothetical protein